MGPRTRDTITLVIYIRWYLLHLDSSFGYWLWMLWFRSGLFCCLTPGSCNELWAPSLSPSFPSCLGAWGTRRMSSQLIGDMHRTSCVASLPGAMAEARVFLLSRRCGECLAAAAGGGYRPVCCPPPTIAMLAWRWYGPIGGWDVYKAPPLSQFFQLHIRWHYTLQEDLVY